MPEHVHTPVGPAHCTFGAPCCSEILRLIGLGPQGPSYHRIPLGGYSRKSWVVRGYVLTDETYLLRSLFAVRLVRGETNTHDSLYNSIVVICSDVEVLVLSVVNVVLFAANMSIIIMSLEFGRQPTKKLRKSSAVIIILVLPPGVVCSSNRALPMLGTADGDAVSRCQVLGRAGSVHHGADQ